MKEAIVIADYSNPVHQKDIVFLLDHYAKDPMGGGEPLAAHVRDKLASALQKIAGAFSVLLYRDQQPVGLTNCFEGFSTFYCKPTINIHDLVVHDSARGLGYSQKLMEHVEAIAKQRGACKITLEVLDGNSVAKHSYKKFGFNSYELDPENGVALVYEKKL